MNLNESGRSRLHGIFLEVIAPFCKVSGASADDLFAELVLKFEIWDERYERGEVLNEVIRYWRKVVDHKIAVFEAGFWVATGVSAGVLWVHDLSKFSAIESVGYSGHDWKAQPLVFFPEFHRAWHHHKIKNEHHPEYWLNPGKDGTPDPIEMPEVFVREMVSDWMGAGRTYGSSLEEWLPNNIHKFCWHENTAIQVKKVLESLNISVEKDGSKLFFKD